MPIIGDTQIQPVNFLEQYMRGQEFARGRRVNEQADQLNALKLQAAEREQSNAMALQQALARGATDEDLMRTPGGMSVLEARASLLEKQGTAATKDLERRIKGAQFLGQSAGAFLNLPPERLNKATLAPWVSQMTSAGLLSPDVTALFEQMPDDPAQLAQGLQVLQMQAVDAEKQTEQEFIHQNLGGSIRTLVTNKRGGGPARVVQGSQAAIGMSPAEQARIRLEGQRVGLEGRRVAVTEGRAKEAKDAAAATAEVIDPKIKAKRETLFPKAQMSVLRVERDVDTQIARVQQLKNHPGLAGITGGIQGRIPSFSADSTAAQALFDTILANGTLSSLTELRAASETGGALGNVSNQDTTLLQNSVGALNQAQGVKSFRQALDDYIRDLEFTKQNARSAFDETYSYRNTSAAKSADDDWEDL
jgi:hypothetical protein